MAGRDDIRGTIGERMEGSMIVYDADGRLVEIDDRPAKLGDEERVARIIANIEAWLAEGDDEKRAPRARGER